MSNYASNGYDYAEAVYENNPYDAYEFDEAGYEEATDLDERGYRRQQSKRSTIHRLQSQINALRRQLHGLSKRAGTPANLARRLHGLERSFGQLQQTQMLSQLLDLPQLESIRFEGEEKARVIEESSLDKHSLLMLQLLGKGGLTGGSGNQMNGILPLLLLGNQNGRGSDQLSNLLLFSMLNNC